MRCFAPPHTQVHAVLRGAREVEQPMRSRSRRSLATELVRLKVDVIVAYYVAPSLAAKQATRDIPIVILAGDPVEMGIVPSLARPGGNITGVSLMGTTLAGKSVELFRDMLPSVRRVGILGHTTNPVYAKTMLDKVLLVAGPIGTRTMSDVSPRCVGICNPSRTI